jgi:hypothetical protein
MQLLRYILEASILKFNEDDIIQKCLIKCILK